jgi:hypothetical protein
MIEDLRYGKLPLDSVLLYEDEKGPVKAKTYMVVPHGSPYSLRYPRLKK